MPRIKLDNLSFEGKSQFLPQLRTFKLNGEEYEVIGSIGFPDRKRELVKLFEVVSGKGKTGYCTIMDTYIESNEPVESYSFIPCHLVRAFCILSGVRNDIAAAVYDFQLDEEEGAEELKKIARALDNYGNEKRFKRFAAEINQEQWAELMLR